MDVKSAHPNLSIADAAFHVPCTLSYAPSYGDKLALIRDLIQPKRLEYQAWPLFQTKF